MARVVKHLQPIDGVTISEFYFFDKLVEVEYNLYDENSYINYQLLDLKIVVYASEGDEIFDRFEPSLSQLEVIHNHLLVKVLPTWKSYGIE
ncbi:hypothetical protein [Vibrio phage vB_VpaP_SJSY21]|nr:hypothetical protein [Vibrio phage vB_VpaP_SJSY21]